MTLPLADGPLLWVALILVGAVASAINTVAGGGSLISFPFLTFAAGLESKIANATNSVALWPGSLGGALGFGKQLDRTRHHLIRLLIPTVLGSLLGAWLLVVSGQRIFSQVVPYLILFAAGLLLAQPAVRRFIRGRHRELPPLAGIGIQFLVAVYGGYFGAGMGIMMLAAFALFMDGNIHEMNAVKTWLGVAINLTASVFLATQGMVNWTLGLWLTLGSVIGGYAAAHWSMRLNPDRLRTAIAVYGVAMAAYYWWSTHR